MFIDLSKKSLNHWHQWGRLTQARCQPTSPKNSERKVCSTPCSIICEPEVCKCRDR